MDHMRVTVTVETWTGLAATRALTTRTVEVSHEDPMPEAGGRMVMDALVNHFVRAVTSAGGTVREIPETGSNTPP